MKTKENKFGKHQLKVLRYMYDTKKEWYSFKELYEKIILNEGYTMSVLRQMLKSLIKGGILEKKKQATSTFNFEMYKLNSKAIEIIELALLIFKKKGEQNNG